MKIIISGTTGVGKSTTVKKLKEKFEEQGKKVVVKGELVLDSPYFDLYFKNISEWGMLAQLDFLLERFKQYVDIEEDSKTLVDDTIIIFDRHFLEDIAFSGLKWVRENTSKFLSNAYHIVYDELTRKLYDEFQKPDYFIMLRASFDTVMERMIDRGREVETNFHEKYWQDLYYRYYAKKSSKEIFIKHSKNFVEIDIDDTTPTESAAKIIKYISKRSDI